jgi:hypothetical protein
VGEKPTEKVHGSLFRTEDQSQAIPGSLISAVSVIHTKLTHYQEIQGFRVAKKSRPIRILMFSGGYDGWT